MTTARRLFVVLLLALVMISFAGHLLNAVSGSPHPFFESICAFHTGVIAPEIVPVFNDQPSFEPAAVSDDTPALCLGVHIHHPPTM